MIWLLILAVAFPLYYISQPYYPDLSRQYENEEYMECRLGRDRCEWLSRVDERELRIRALSWVADFIEMPLHIIVKNISDDYQNAVVGVELGVSVAGHVYLREGDREQRLSELKQYSFAFESIPPGGEAVKILWVRVSGGEVGEKYTLHFLLEDKRIEVIKYEVTFDRKQILRLWIMEHLLFPPGANVVLPIASLLFVSTGEICYGWALRAKRRVTEVIIEIGKIIRDEGEGKDQKEKEKTRKRLKLILCSSALEVLWGVSWILLSACLLARASQLLTKVLPEDWIHFITDRMLISVGIGGVLGLLKPDSYRQVLESQVTDDQPKTSEVV